MNLFENKKVKIGGAIIAILILAGGLFYSGIFVGKKYYPSINLIKGVKNLEAGKPADADFSLFWDAWRVVQSDFVKSNQLDRQKMVYGAIKGLLGSLEDPYSVFFDPEEAKRFSEDVKGNFSGIGIEIGLKKQILTVISPLEDTPAFKAGLKAGDQIIKIDGKSTADLNSDEAIKMIRGERGTKVTLNIMRKDFEKPKDFSIVRDQIIVPAVKLEFKENNIAYLKLNNFNENSPKDFYNAAIEILNRQSPAMILDLRNNPGGYLEAAVNIAGWMIKKGEPVVRENLKGGKETVFRANGNQALVNLPIVVLINEGSASASEILAGALRDSRQIKLIGQKSFGKGSVQQVEKMFDDSMIKITIAEWLTPNGTSINENGLKPDIESEMPEDSSNTEDVQLKKALETIKQKI